MVLTVTNEEVRACLDMDDAIEAMETAYRAEAAGRAVDIPRSDMLLPISSDEAYVFKIQPGAIEDLSVSAIRMQSDRVRWGETRKTKVAAARDDQYAQHVLVYDTDRVEPILLMPDGFASKMRVGATNALGAQYMAPDASTVGLLGAGRQAGGQVWGFDTVLDLEEIRVYSPTRTNREAFAEEWDARLDASVVAVDGPREAVGGADVFACATNSMEPVFEPEWVEAGQHVSTVKNPEIHEGVFERVDRLAVHSHSAPHGPHNYTPRGSSFADRMDDAWGIEAVDFREYPNLGDLLAGDPGRREDETTMFANNNGAGIQWAAVGRQVHDAADEAGLGEHVDTGLFLQSMW